MNYFTYIKNSDDQTYIKKQELLIEEYIKKLNIKVIKKYISDSTDNKKTDKYFDEKVIKQLDHCNELIISDITSLGSSEHIILQKIIQLKEKRINLRIIEDELYLSIDKNDLYRLLTAILNADKIFKKKRIELAKKSREESGKKIGRKPGKKTKSVFDGHKNLIFKLYELQVPITKILEKIKEKDKKLQDITSQALRQYIKKIEKNNENKIQTDKVKKEQLKQRNIKEFNEATKYREKNIKIVEK